MRWPGAHAALDLGRLLLVDGLLDALDQGEHVAHAEDPRGHPVGEEDLEVLGLLAGAGEPDLLAGGASQGERGAASSVAVELGQDHAVEADRREKASPTFTASWPVIESATSSVSVTGTAAFSRFSSSISSPSTWRRPAVSRITTSLPRRCASLIAAAAMSSTLPCAGVEGDLLALGEGAQLVDGGGAPQVEGGQERAVAVAPCQEGELDRGRRLARALEPDQHHDGGGAAVAKALRVAAQELDQLVVDGLDDLLRGGQAGGDLHACDPRPHPLDELLDDLEVDVGFEEGHADLAEAGVDVLGAEDAAAGDLLEGGGEALAQGFEHLDDPAAPCAASGPSSSRSRVAMARRRRAASFRRPSRAS